MNTSNAVFEDQGHAGNGGRFLKRRILTLRDPGAMEIPPLKWAPQVPRTRERETTDPNPTMISPGKAIKPPIHLEGLSAYSPIDYLWSRSPKSGISRVASAVNLTGRRKFAIRDVRSSMSLLKMYR